MFYYHDSVTNVPQPLQHRYKSLGITRMQSNARFIKYIKRSHKGTSQSCDQIYSLALSTGQGIRCSVKGKVSETYILDILKP